MGGRGVVDVGFVMGVFISYFDDLQSTKAQPHKNIILMEYAYCTLLAMVASLESQYYPTWVKNSFVCSW